jgi:hypothetical protein
MYELSDIIQSKWIAYVAGEYEMNGRTGLIVKIDAANIGQQIEHGIFTPDRQVRSASGERLRRAHI